MSADTPANPVAAQPATVQDPELVKGLGFTASTSLVMGSMIGSGIFIVPVFMSRDLQSPGLLILAWVITGVMTVSAALAYGELAAAMPRAGGQYVYLREAFGPMTGFLYGWTLFLVIYSGFIAAVGVAFGKFMGHFIPWITPTEWIWRIGTVPERTIAGITMGGMQIGLNRENLVAIVSIFVLTLINVYGVRLGALVQVTFTIAKTGALIGLIFIGIFIGRNPEAVAANFGNFWANPVAAEGGGLWAVILGTAIILALAQVGSLFSSDAWNSVTFTAGEVRNPKRNLPLSLAVGTSSVILLYILANFAYLSVLPLWGDPQGADTFSRGIQYAVQDRVGTAAMEQAFGVAGATFMTSAILISVFGCNNGLILSGARVYYAMAKDGLFFRAVTRLHPTYKTPTVSLWVQFVWASVLCLSGSYGDLLDYIIFAVLIFYALTIAGVFVLRRTRPEMERPYRAIGYPVLPALYIVMALFIDVVLLRFRPQYTWPGLIIVLLGIPVYFLWSRHKRRQAEA